MDKLGQRLRALRERRGRSLKDVAADLGIHFTTVGKYETGVTSIPVTLIERWCEVLGARGEVVITDAATSGPVQLSPTQALLVADVTRLAHLLPDEQARGVRALLRSLVIESDPEDGGASQHQIVGRTKHLGRHLPPDKV